MNTDHPFYSRTEDDPPWVKQEKNLAKAFGWRTPGSGATKPAHNKGDVQSDRMIIEAKSTSKGSFRLTYSDLAKVHREASSIGKVPALFIRFEKDTPNVVEEREWVVVPRSWFEGMLYNGERSGVFRKTVPKD